MEGHIKRGCVVDRLTPEILDQLQTLAGHKLLNTIVSEATITLCRDNVDLYLIDKLQRSFGAEVKKFGKCILVKIVGGLSDVADKLVKVVENVKEYRGEDKV